MGSAIAGGLGLAVSPLFRCEHALASELVSQLVPGATGERMAAAEASFYRAYRSKPVAGPEAITWAQIDLGSPQTIDAVKLYPAKTHLLSGEGFPSRFRIECSDDPSFEVSQLIADRSKTDYPNPNDSIVQFPAKTATGRFVRVTATRLRPNELPAAFLTLPAPVLAPIQKAVGASHVFALAKVEVLSGGTDIAVGRSVAVDSILGNSADAQQITRAPRPQGEGLITDNLENVTGPGDWRPVRYRAHSPLSGLQLQGGLLATAIENNIAYLLESFTVDDLLRQFRQRAGKPLPIDTRTPHAFWEETLAGSNAGRFLMGAANTLHWIDHAELRSRMNAVVEGIAECQQGNGYIMAYPEDTFFVSERGAYTRAWVTHGLIEAGYAGNAQAFELLRGYYDWFNRMPYLPQALRGCVFGPQGMVANSRLYFTPVGKPADVQVLQRYFQENYWLEDLAARKVDAVWQYPYDRPHSYLLTFLEPYLDLYRATGDRQYLNAVLGGWELFRENWQQIGGSFSIIELQKNEPKSYPLYEALGETCGNAFWMLLNQRLHLLAPDEEKYVTEIEKSIYNVLLANQAGVEGIRYHSKLLGQKEIPTRINTCCEGQGTRLLGSLPQFIYSIADDGLYVNLFEPSTLTWEYAGAVMRLEMETSFPTSTSVTLNISSSKPVQAKIRIRTPSWGSGVMSIAVNGVRTAKGAPGSYVTIDRTWSSGDVISFDLPMELRLTKYTGIDQIQGRERFALEYGPILMAALGAADTEILLRLAASPLDLVSKLQPVEGRPLHYKLSGIEEAEFVPYFEIGSEFFSCFPFIEAKASLL
jgi:DUF1680 family protein